MSEAPAPEAPFETPPSVTLTDIFVGFLVIGATSFGGGVVAYLRSGLVGRRKWIADETFVELLSICQTLPGLNASNMAILVGDRLRGTAGAAVALAGICLPGALMMVAAAAAYAASRGSEVGIGAVLHGVSAAAVGLVLAVTFQLGRKSLTRMSDLVFVALTVIGVDLMHQSVLLVLVVVGALAIYWYRPGRLPEHVKP
ncbi:chromate transporter [Aquabacter cavernae]|uniref:chromate transporter n=1 Tax=Aquabacter cavernae TaxID=2496029 RepID=UPI000F8F0932|nr:chromate transporter [Aquabacter cavernae]